jgi:hypothetical protein
VRRRLERALPVYFVALDPKKLAPVVEACAGYIASDYIHFNCGGFRFYFREKEFPDEEKLIRIHPVNVRLANFWPANAAMAYAKRRSCAHRVEQP